MSYAINPDPWIFILPSDYCMGLVLCFIQDGAKIAVAIKTCKVDCEDTRADSFLEEASEYQDKQ